MLQSCFCIYRGAQANMLQPVGLHTIKTVYNTILGLNYNATAHSFHMDIQSANESMPLSMTAAVLPNDIITEILSFLPVKSLLQFRCVCDCKSWKTLTSELSFVKLHLNRSALQNPQFTIVTLNFKELFKGLPQSVIQVGHSVIPYSWNSLIHPFCRSLLLLFLQELSYSWFLQWIDLFVISPWR